MTIPAASNRVARTAAAFLLATACLAARQAMAQARWDWDWDFEQPPSETANDGINGWFPTGQAGFDAGKGLALHGTGNAWVRAARGWHAMNRRVVLDEVPNGYACTFSIWVRTSATLDAGYVAVRDGSDPPDAGETLGSTKLVGERVYFNRRIVPNQYENGYELIAVQFVPPASRKVLILAGLLGNGGDAWMQLDDAAVRCRRLPF